MTTVTVTVTSGTDPFSLTSNFHGVSVTTSGNLTVNTAAGTLTGSVSVTAVNSTTGATILSRSFSVALNLGPSNSVKFIFAIQAGTMMLASTCSLTVNSLTPSCAVSGDPDVDQNGDVAIQDVARVALAFGSTQGSPRFNPQADLNMDGKVSILDVAMASYYFGAYVFQ